MLNFTKILPLGTSSQEARSAIQILPNRSSNIVCIGARWNQLGQVGVPRGWGLLGSLTLGAFNTPIESCVFSHDLIAD